MHTTAAEMIDKPPYRFADLVDLSAFGRVLESFFLATGIPNGLVDVSGELLTLAAGKNACTVFHRVNPKSAERCLESNLAIMRDLHDGCFAGGLCLNGLMDYATPVVIEGHQLATLFLGQVLHAPPDVEMFRAQAAECGFDEKSYLESIAAIPIVDKTRMKDLMAVMVEMAHILAASGLAKLRQAALERDIGTHIERQIQLEDILDFSPIAIGWSEGETRIEYVNRQFTLLFGYTLDDLPDLETWYRRAYPDEHYRKTVVRPWRDAVALARQHGVQPPELEADVTCKDGSSRRVVIQVAWIGIRRMVSFTDITERKRIENDLRHSQEMLADAQRVAKLGSWDWNVVDDRVEWSEMAYEIYTPDKHPAELGFEDFKSSLHPDDVERVAAAVQSAFERDMPFDLDHRVVSVSKGIRTVHARGKVFRDMNGKPVRMVGTVQDITERKRMEDALRISEAHSRDHDRLLQAVLESSPEVIVFALDRDYRYLAFNDKHRTTMSAIWGKEIVVGMNMLDVIGAHPDREKAQLGFDRALTGEAFVTEDAYGDEAILRLYWQNFFAPIHGQDGSIVGLTCFVLNITERRRLELALAAREQELRSLAESSPDVVIRVDRDLRIRYLNANMVKALELDSPEELIGRRSSEIWSDGRFNEIDALRERVVRSGEIESVEVVVPAPGGKRVYHHVVSVPERDTDGHIIGTLSFGRDVTAIRETERRLNSLVENLPGVAFTIRLSPQGELSFPYVSAGVEEIYGVTPEAAMSDFSVMHGMVHPDDKAGMEEAYAESTRTLTTFRIEVRICPPGQAERWLDVRSDPEAQPDGGIVSYGIMLDITERRRIEHRIQTHDTMLEMIARDTDLSTILEALVHYMESESKTSRCSIMLVDAEGRHLPLGAAPSLPAFFNDATNGTEIGVGIGSCGTTAALGQRVVVEDIQVHEYWRDLRELAKSAGLRSCWSEPILSSRGKVLGTFAIFHTVPTNLQYQDNGGIAFAANLAAIAIENRQVHEELERQAHTDYLTGLANRRHFLEQAESELARTLRYGRDLSILMFDIDHFKRINDTYGHKVGDIVLKKLSMICLATLRNVDVIGRIGGEEFAVLLPETESEQAMDAAERLRAAIASAQVMLNGGLPLRFTASFGVATLSEKGANIDMLLNQADQALYLAKKDGRNQVRMYRDEQAKQ